LRVMPCEESQCDKGPGASPLDPRTRLVTARLLPSAPLDMEHEHGDRGDRCATVPCQVDDGQRPRA
jgi:hypothetical protein